MAENKARLGKLAVSTNGSAYTDVGELKSCNLALDKDMADSTSYDDSGYKSEVAVLQQVTISGSCNYDEADAGQTILLTSINAQTQIYFRWRPLGDDVGTDKEYIFQGNPTGSIDGEVGGLLELSFDAASSGTVTYQTQA